MTLFVPLVVIALTFLGLGTVGLTDEPPLSQIDMNQAVWAKDRSTLLPVCELP